MYRILVVDDEVVITTQLEERLTYMGYNVIGNASFGEEAVELSEKLKPDIILMDIVMPYGKLDGIDAAKIIKEELDIPVIFLSAYADDQFIERAKSVEPFGYILKPFQENEIKASIEIAIYKRNIERRLRVLCEEKNVFLKEMHHRVKNNFQIIYSLFKLQSRHIKDKQSLRFFQESINRVRSMWLIHEKLYQPERLTDVNIADYIDSLLKYYRQLYDGTLCKLDFKTSIEKIAMNIDTAIPCGLIINELITNSLKYAFIKPLKDKKNEIRIKLFKDKKNNVKLIVSDNGVGFPENIDFQTTQSLGLQLVCTLVDQLDGSIELDRSEGTAFTVKFRLSK